MSAFVHQSLAGIHPGPLDECEECAPYLEGCPDCEEFHSPPFDGRCLL